MEMSVDLSQAKCATKENPWEIFFPTGEDIQAKINYAKAICAQCPVAVACLKQVMDAGSDKDVAGIWGMTTVTERRLMRREPKLLAVHIQNLNNRAI